MNRKPEYRVAAMDKLTDEKNNIGAAWVNSDGSIRIKLDSFIVLTAGPNLVITMFPNREP